MDSLVSEAVHLRDELGGKLSDFIRGPVGAAGCLNLDAGKTSQVYPFTSVALYSNRFFRTLGVNKRQKSLSSIICTT
jgi:hypothetical protein